MFISSPPRFICILPKSLNLIACRGDMKGKFSINFRKIFFLETIRGMKLKPGKHAQYISLYINYVLFRSDKNSGCYGNLYFP